MSSNDLYVNYLTRAYSSFINSQISGTQTKGMDFQDYVSRAEEEEGKVSETGQTRAPSVSEMTLEQYKQYIHNKISQIPMHPSQVLSSISIHISDEGFRAMQNDPEYEKWVLDTLKADFGFNDPWTAYCGGRFSVHHFGATKEEYRGEGWYMGFQGGKASSIFDQESEESFWEKRAKRQKKYLKQQQESAEEKAIMKRVYQEAAMRRGDLKDMFIGEEIAQSLSLANLLFIGEDANTKV